MEEKPLISNLKEITNIKYKKSDEINTIFQEYLQNIPDIIILPLDEEISDENISKNLFKKEKNNMYINPLDEILIEEISYFNEEINKFKNQLEQLLENLNKNKNIKEDIITQIIKENNIESSIKYLKNKNDFYKNWLKEGELKKYYLNYINNVNLLFYLLKTKYLKNIIISSNKNNKKILINYIELEEIVINYSGKKENDNSIEIAGLSLNLIKHIKYPKLIIILYYLKKIFKIKESQLLVYL